MTSVEDDEAAITRRVAIEVHTAILEQKHGDLMRSLPWLVLSLAMASMPLVSVRFAPLVLLAPVPALWVGYRFYEWWIVRRQDRRARVALVFIVAAVGGNIASTLASAGILAGPSVGASGGVLGLAGYSFSRGGYSEAMPAWRRKPYSRRLACCNVDTLSRAGRAAPA